MSPQLVFSLLLLLAVPAEALAAGKLDNNPLSRQAHIGSDVGLLLAQAELDASTFAVPDGLPWGTTVRLDGDPSNTPTNRTLQQGFSQRFSGSTIQLASRGSDIAIQSLLDGDLDIAAIGRRLTSQERAKGLVAVPLARHKIAIIIGPDNPFTGSLSDVQFAQIFRGEITDWEELGGEPGPIRLIDRPETSDTRRAFANYPVFQDAPLKAGSSSIQVNDRTDDVIKALGSDGIGYAIVDQVSDRNDLSIVPLHKVLPDDPRYAFSQPLAYVYKGPVPSPAAQAFLGYAGAASQSGELVAEKTALNALGSTGSLESDGAGSDGSGEDVLGDRVLNATESEGAIALDQTAQELRLDAPVAQAGQTTARSGRAPWWWLLLPLAIIPLLFRWMKRGSGPLAWGNAASASTGVAGVMGAVPTEAGRWNAGRFVTGETADASGEVVGEGAALATAKPRRVIPMTAKQAGLAGAGLAAASMKSATEPRLIMTARDCHHAYAYWELSDKQRQSFREQGGQTLKLRLFDVTKPIRGQRPFRQYDCRLEDYDLEIPIRHDNHLYQAELGYLTDSNDWMTVASCEPIRVPACEVRTSQPMPAGEAGLQTPHRQTVASDNMMPPAFPQAAHTIAPNSTQPELGHPEPVKPEPVKPESLQQLPDAAKPANAEANGKSLNETSKSNRAGRKVKSQEPVRKGAVQKRAVQKRAGDDRTWITLTPLNSKEAQVNWHISQEHQQQIEAQGGKHLQMKIHDADHIDLDKQPPHSTHTYACAEGEEMHRVELPYSDRDYVAEIGYMTEEQQWLRVARSIHSHSPTPEYDGCRIVIMPCDPNRLILRGPDTKPQAYVYWDISEERRQVLQQQGGKMLVLRVYDADQIDLEHQEAHHTEEVILDELARDEVVEVPRGDRDYVAEIGYRTLEGEFLSLGRSLHARIPQVKSSAS